MGEDFGAIFASRNQLIYYLDVTGLSVRQTARTLTIKIGEARERERELKIESVRERKMSSGWGSIGWVIASYSRGHRFESIYCQLYWKDENKQKRGLEWAIFEEEKRDKDEFNVCGACLRKWLCVLVWENGERERKVGRWKCDQIGRIFATWAKNCNDVGKF